MMDAFKSLPKDPDELRSVSEQMARHIQSQAYQIEKLKAELHGHRKARFGAKSESIDQLALDLPEDDEIAQAADDQHAEQSAGDEEPPTQTRAKRQHSRKPLPDHLDRKDEILSPGDACHDCGGTLRQVGEDVTEELDYIPGHFVVRRFIRPRMACTCCEAFAQAPLPSRLIERGRPGPGLVSHMLIGKYCDHLPLERQSQDLRTRRGRSASFHAERLGRSHHNPAGTFGLAHRQTGPGRPSPVCGRHTRKTTGAGQYNQNQDCAALELRAR